ncbi:MAG: lysophospholipid acyltransferase family protein [Marmoricola sp.]
MRTAHGRRRPDDRFYARVNALGRVLLRALALEVTSEGAEHLPDRGPVVLASNHVSFPDFVLIERAAITRGRYVRFLCRHDVWGPPVVGAAMDRMGHVPVDRRDAATAYLRARALLRSGEAVGVFPEAGISHSYTVRPLMRGAVSLARETGAPLVPVAVWGGQRLFPVRPSQQRVDLTRGRPATVVMGPARRIAADVDLVEETRALGHLLTRMLEEVQQRPEHRPRPGEWASWYPAHLGGRAPDRRAARVLDDVPASAVLPTWGPDRDAWQGPAPS